MLEVIASQKNRMVAEETGSHIYELPLRSLGYYISPEDNSPIRYLQTGWRLALKSTITVLGLDVGGANTKAVAAEVEDSRLKRIWKDSTYLPLWRVGRERLASHLHELKSRVRSFGHLDAVGVTMTAELSDVYSTKREGMNHILNLVEDAFQGSALYVLRTDGKLASPTEAREDPLKVASANWAATGWLASQLFEEGVVIDVGSTTTSIIPLSGGKVAAKGATDLEKLGCGELVYTGALRTNVAAIVDAVPLRDGRVRASSEYFTSTGDIHLVLGNLRPEEYTVEAPDGKGHTRGEALARIARLVCADMEMLGEDEILGVARYVEERQILQIVRGLEQVLSERGLGSDAQVAITGVGRNFLAKRAAERLGLTHILDLGAFVGDEVATVSTAYAVALLTASKLVGGSVEWAGRF